MDNQIQPVQKRRRCRAPGRDREHLYPGGRDRRMNLRLDEAEYELLCEAAARVGLTPTGYAAAAAVAAARGGSVADSTALRGLRLEMLQAHTQLRKFGTNVNQAVAALNATGQAPGWLESAVALCRRASERLFEVTDRLDRQMR